MSVCVCAVGLCKQNVWTNLHLFLQSVEDMLICSLIGLIKGSDAERKPPSYPFLSLSATMLQKKKRRRRCFFFFFFKVDCMEPHQAWVLKLAKKKSATKSTCNCCNKLTFILCLFVLGTIGRQRKLIENRQQKVHLIGVSLWWFPPSSSLIGNQ